MPSTVTQTPDRAPFVLRDPVHIVMDAEGADWREMPARVRTEFDAPGGPVVTIAVGARLFELRLVEVL
jgi:hypothetical protein